MAVSPRAIRTSTAEVDPTLRRSLSTMDEGAGLRCGYWAEGSARLWIVDRDAGVLAPLRSSAPLLQGAVSPPFVAPSLVIQTSDLEFMRFEVSAQVLEAGVPWPAPATLPAQVQLLARGPFGLQPVASRRWEPGAQRAARRLRAYELRSHESLAGALNRLRRGTGRALLRRHRLLRQAAARHARAVCLRGRAAHELVPGADPTARLRQLGVGAMRLGEVVSRSSDPAAAFNALLSSPSHLMAMLERGFTDAGVGTAHDSRGGVCLVMVFARFPHLLLSSEPAPEPETNPPEPGVRGD